MSGRKTTDYGIGGRCEGVGTAQALGVMRGKDDGFVSQGKTRARGSCERVSRREHSPARDENRWREDDLTIASSRPGKRVRHLTEPAIDSSQVKPCIKRRRLYSMPEGILEPRTTASSQSDGSMAGVVRPRKTVDTASRPNESVYDMLLEHSVKRSNRGWHGRPCRKARGGKKATPNRQRRKVAPPTEGMIGECYPPVPGRQATTAAARNLSGSSGQKSENRPSRAASESSMKTLHEAAGEQASETVQWVEKMLACDEVLERGNTEIYFLPNVGAPEDVDSDDDDAFEPTSELSARKPTGTPKVDVASTHENHCGPNGAANEPGCETGVSKKVKSRHEPEPTICAPVILNTCTSEASDLPLDLSPDLSITDSSEWKPSFHSSSSELQDSGSNWLGSGVRMAKRAKRVYMYSRFGREVKTQRGTSASTRAFRSPAESRRGRDEATRRERPRRRQLAAAQLRVWTAGGEWRQRAGAALLAACDRLEQLA
ncbi:uncharacterized protein LOC119103184 [Pollicipes pollicipes]|uniref:uncharacterized protein LOC119103184 n=1 Tax=Pollicipes pollicipes TaxID=41117 RepID=UPI0018849915|nr:uncharacterized protein LOC119103184 [Pollicipes pollicipes]